MSWEQRGAAAADLSRCHRHRRCRCCCCCCCCCCCRYEESLAAYNKVLAADPNWYSWSSYVNVMALYPFVILGARGPKVCRYTWLAHWA
jgi:hypothetical protein